MFNIFNTGNDRMFNKVPLYPNNNLDNILYSQLSTFKKYMYKESFLGKPQFHIILSTLVDLTSIGKPTPLKITKISGYF